MTKHLWITLLALWISALPLDGFSKDLPPGTKCGVYEIYGVVKSKDGIPTIKIFEKSISEVTFKVDADLAESLKAYMDQAVIVKARLLKPVHHQQGQLDSDQASVARTERNDIKERVPDPLYPMKDSQMNLLKELPCSKKD